MPTFTGTVRVTTTKTITEVKTYRYKNKKGIAEFKAKDEDAAQDKMEGFIEDLEIAPEEWELEETEEDTDTEIEFEVDSVDEE